MTKINWSLQHKRDTASNWASDNPILLSGQFGIETDTNKLKLGTGANWNSTPYFGGGGSVDSVNGQTGTVVLDFTDVGAEEAGRILYKDQSWFDANTTLVLDGNQIAFLGQTGRYKKGDGATQLQTLAFLGSGGGVRFDTNIGGFPAVGEIDVIYVAKDTGLIYQWDGVSSYVELSASGGVDAVDSVNGKIGVVVLDKTDIGLGNVDNTSDANKPISTATQTALDGKVDENVAITGATKTKITYDAKGLVTSGADATTADIADSTDKRYVTNANLVVINNTSGVNTGDQNLTPYFNKLVDDTDDITEGTTNKFATSAEKTKLGFITVTQSVDLDVIESDTVINNAKVTNATHTGEMTGATVLTADKTLITNKSSVAAAVGDSLLISDVSDSGNLKQTTVQDILNLIPTGSTYITGTAIVNFGSENDFAVTTVSNASITNTGIKNYSFVPQDTTDTSLDDFSLNGVSFSIENIVDNTSFDVRGTAVNNASNNYTIKYLIQI